MAGTPGDRISALEAENEVETPGDDAEAVGIALLRRDQRGSAGHCGEPGQSDRR
jgi:hypothetical protein